MDLGRSLVKLTIAGGCVLGGLAFPPLLAGEIVWETVVATALSSVAAGNAANVIDALLSGKGDEGVSLQNQDLTKAVGKAIAAVITLAVKGYPNKTTRNNLEKIAAQAKNNWVKIAQQELTKKSYPQLREVNLDQFLTPEEYYLTQEGNLKPEEWQDIFIRLNMAACKGGGFQLPAEVYQQVGELLHTTFPKALRETLKEDFASDGKAFAGLTLQLLTGMKAELVQLRHSNSGAKAAELMQILQEFQQLETQLRGTVTQQQEFFRQISQDIDSGFTKVCQQLGVMETNITRLLQNLEERLDALDEKLTRLETQGGRQLSKRELRNRQKLLAEMRTEAESRLSQSLHNAVLLNLGKEQQPHQVERPWDVSVKVGEQRAFQLPSETGILEVFEDQAMGGKFLILGKPGGGKTTTLLELLRDLVDRAEMDSDAPIPVILELSEWQTVTERKFPKFWEQEKYDPSIKEWIISQLRSKGVSQEIGEQWIRDKELVLLLDGLDELPSERQAKCVKAINQFLDSEFSPLHLVVCSRKEEYEEYEEVLHLNGAICLEDLSVEQIQNYFASVNLGEFWESIKDSEKIVNFISQPLFLAITSIAYQQIDVEEWRNCNTEERAIDYLLGVYRVNRLTQKILSRLYETTEQPKASFSQNAMIKISRFLENNNLKQKEFSIYSLQPSLLNKNKILYDLFVFFVVVILYLAFGLIFANRNFDSSNFLAINDYLSIIFTFIITFMSGLSCSIYLAFGFNKITESELSKKLATNKFGNILLSLLLLSILLLIFTAFGVTLFMLYSINNIESLRISWMYWDNPLHRWFVSALGVSGLLTCFRGETINFLNLIKKMKRFNIWDLKIFFAICFFETIVVFFAFWHDLINLFANAYSISLPNSISRLSPNIEIILLILPILYGLTFIWILLTSTKYQNEQYISKNNNVLFHQLIALLLLFLIGIITGIAPIFRLDTHMVLNNSFVLGFMSGLFAGFSLIQYFSLRLILWLTGQMPWNITRFLDYCTERLILQRVGNRYRFIHRLVQEHFANLEIQKD